MKNATPHRPAAAGRRRVRDRAVTLAILVLGALALAGDALAEPRAHQIQWGHPAPASVARFVALISATEGDAAGAREVNLGKPNAPQPPGIPLTLYSAVVSFEDTEFLAIAAIGLDGQMSVPSDWVAMPPTTPGQPNLAGQ